MFKKNFASKASKKSYKTFFNIKYWQILKNILEPSLPALLLDFPNLAINKV